MIGRLETGKDTVQEVAETTAAHVGRVASIVSGTVRDLSREFGNWATDLFEVRDAIRRARAMDR